MTQAMEQVSSERISNEFSYKPWPVTAPVSLVLGVCSAIALTSALALPVCVFGVVLGTICLARIRRSGGELGGRRLAQCGVFLSTAFLVSGSVFHAYVFATEVPEGSRRVSFYRDISQKGFVQENGVAQIHPDVRTLDGQKIFLKGYMYPTRQTTDIETFVLVKDNQQCCFGGQPKPNDMILINMQDKKTVDYSQGLVAVSGVFHAQPPKEAGPLSPVYHMDGQTLEAAKTSY